MTVHVYIDGERVDKAANVEAHLHVIGVQSHPSGSRIYRLATRDGHYVGRSNPTKRRALKGDVVRVVAAHLSRTANGDISWQNAEVMAIGSYPRRADDHLSLLRRIGDQATATALVKDNATAVPAAGDEGNALDADEEKKAPVGPTSNSVHVGRPLKTLSVSYAGKPRRLKVVKAMHDQLVYGIVLEPDVIDSQADYVPAAHVEKAAHGYMRKALRGRASVAKLSHRMPGFKRDRPSVVPVESFIAPCDFTYPGSQEPVKKGSWVMAMHVEDPSIWQDVLDGRYGGFSIGGTGKRQRMGGMMMPPAATVG